MRIHRQEYVDWMSFSGGTRPLLCELFGPLVGLPEEWIAQGATPSELDLTAFEFDYCDRVEIPINRPVGLPNSVVLEETPEHCIKRDGLGRTTKLIKSAATIALPLDHPVKTEDDWAKLKPHYAVREDRFDLQAVQDAKRQQDAGALAGVEILGGYDEIRQLMGDENACMAFYLQPDLLRDLFATWTKTAAGYAERLLETFVPDYLFIHEDFAGKSGPLIGPKVIDDFLAPYYQACIEPFRQAGTKLFSQDSDGDIMPVLDAILDAGVNQSHPFEPTAGMDIVEVRKIYGHRVGIKGGLDKHVLRGSREDIRRELEYKLTPNMWQEGGICFALDHRIPNGTPLEHYRYYVDLAREILGIEPRTGNHSGWSRMAF